MLHFETLVQSDHRADRAFVFVHGILGSGGNLRAIARRVVEACPRYAAYLVDLRGHGKSPLMAPPHTVAACASDLQALSATWSHPVHAILGHSFGGKVSMAFAGSCATLAHLVVVDAMPGPRAGGRGSESTLAVFDALARCQGPYPTRDAFVAALIAEGIEKTTAMWLAMSLKRQPDGMHVSYDLVALRALLDDYFAQDLWSVLETPRTRRDQLVIGSRSTVFSESDRERAFALQATSGLDVVTLDAGHWVHVDAADGLVEALIRLVKEDA